MIIISNKPPPSSGSFLLRVPFQEGRTLNRGEGDLENAWRLLNFKKITWALIRGGRLKKYWVLNRIIKAIVFQRKKIVF